MNFSFCFPVLLSWISCYCCWYLFGKVAFDLYNFSINFLIQNKINLFDQLKNLINKIKPDFWKFAHLAHLYADSGVRSSKLD